MTFDDTTCRFIIDMLNDRLATLREEENDAEKRRKDAQLWGKKLELEQESAQKTLEIIEKDLNDITERIETCKKFLNKINEL